MLNLDTLYTDYARAQAYPESYKSGLEEEIRKSIGGGVAIAGYQTAAQADAASEFSPLIPEALDDIIGQVDFRAEQLEFFDWLPKKDTKNTVTTWMKTVENGDPWLERALSEGLISVNDAGRNSRDSTKIKSYVETRELTDIQNAVPLAGGGVGGVGVPSSALAFQTTKGMLALHRALERDSMFGAGYSAAPNKLDGVQPQLIRAGQYTNMDGAQVTMEYLEDLVRTLQSAPYYGRPTDILVSPKIYTSLTKQQIAFGRRAMDGSSVTYGFDEKGGLVVLAGNQRIPVKPMVFQDNQADAPPAFNSKKENTAIGATAPAIPTIAAGFGSVVGTSYFGAGDVGDYYYHVVAYSDTGAYSTMALTGVAGVNALKITSVAGQKNSFTIDDPTGATVTYYHIFRTRKGATAAESKDVKKYQFLFTVAKTNAAGTVVDDTNSVRNDCGSVMVLRRDPEEIVLYQLIKLFRKPLAQTRMSQPFALFTACGLQVKVPEHQWLLTNVGY